MQVQGTINAVFPAEKVSDSFTKRVFWLNTDEDSKYPQVIHLEFTQDKCSDLNHYKAGEKVEVEFNLRGRQWKDKVFNTLQAWKIKKIDIGADGKDVYKEVNPSTVSIVDDGSDLPF